MRDPSRELRDRGTRAGYPCPDEAPPLSSRRPCSSGSPSSWRARGRLRRAFGSPTSRRQAGSTFVTAHFASGSPPIPCAMMGSGLCWLDYDRDGWLDLFVVNSYAERDAPRWQRRGGLPRSALFRNVKGKFVDVSRRSGANLALRGMGCVAADLDRDGDSDLYVTAAGGSALLWNEGNGRFREGAAAAGVDASRLAELGCGRRRQRGRPSGSLRRRLHRPERSDRGVERGLPEQSRGRARPALPQPGRPPLPRGRSCRRASRRPASTTRLGARLLRPRPGRPARPLRRERRGSEPALRERRLARWREGRPGRARLPLRGAGRRRRRRRPERRHGRRERRRRRRRADRPLRQQLARPAARGPERPAAGAERRRRSPTGAPGFAAAFGRSFTGWGVSWADLDLDGDPDLVLANGSIPVTNLAPGRPADPGAREPGRRRARRGSSRTPASAGLPLVRRPRPRRRRLRQRRPARRRDQLGRRSADPAQEHRRGRATGSRSRCPASTRGRG